MEGRRNKKKKEGQKQRRNLGGKEKEKKTEREKKKKKSSAGFKLVRLVLLVFLSVKREGVVGRIGFTFLPSWATRFAVIQPADSPSPAAPLCWGSSFLQRLSRSCRALCERARWELFRTSASDVVACGQPGH